MTYFTSNTYILKRKILTFYIKLDMNFDYLFRSSYMPV